MPKITNYFTAGKSVPTKVTKQTTVISSSFANAPAVDTNSALLYMLDGIRHTEEEFKEFVRYFLGDSGQTANADARFLAVRVASRLVMDKMMAESDYPNMVQLLASSAPNDIPMILRSHKFRISNEYALNLGLRVTIADYINEIGYLLRDGGHTVSDVVNILKSNDYDLFTLPTQEPYRMLFVNRRKAASNPNEGVELEVCPACNEKTLNTILFTYRSWDEGQGTKEFCTNQQCATYR